MFRTLADISSLGVTPGTVLLGASLVCVMYLTFRPKRRDPLASQPFRTSLVQQRALERDMQSVIVELNAMAREMTAQLETRSVKLEQLMHEADCKLAELRSASASFDAAAATHADGVPSGSGVMTIETSAPSLQAATEPAAALRPPMRLVSDHDHSEERWSEVYRLGDEGLSLPEIARQLKRPNGEIELILALRPKRSTAAGAENADAVPAFSAQA